MSVVSYSSLVSPFPNNLLNEKKIKKEEKANQIKLNKLRDKLEEIQLPEMKDEQKLFFTCTSRKNVFRKKRKNKGTYKMKGKDETRLNWISYETGLKK